MIITKKTSGASAKELSITEARDKLTLLPEELMREPGALAVTRRGEPVLAIMPWELYESIVETVEIMGDEELMADLHQAVKEIEAGKTISWERAKKEL